MPQPRCLTLIICIKYVKMVWRWHLNEVKYKLEVWQNRILAIIMIEGVRGKVDQMFLWWMKIYL